MIVRERLPHVSYLPSLLPSQDWKYKLVEAVGSSRKNIGLGNRTRLECGLYHLLSQITKMFTISKLNITFPSLLSCDIYKDQIKYARAFCMITEYGKFKVLSVPKAI